MSPQRATAHLRIVNGPEEPGSGRPRAQLDDTTLVAAIARGDVALSAEICEALLAVVDRTLVRVLGRRDADHDDLVQAALEQIVLTICREKFGQRCSLSTWASAIASNVGLHAIRKRRVERALFDVFEDVDDLVTNSRRVASPEALLVARQDLRRVRHHLAHMSERLAHALVLHDLLGYDVEETAATLRLSVTATQSRLSRGRRELVRRLLKDEKQRVRK